MRQRKKTPSACSSILDHSQSGVLGVVCVLESRRCKKCWTGTDTWCVRPVSGKQATKLVRPLYERRLNRVLHGFPLLLTQDIEGLKEKVRIGSSHTISCSSKIAGLRIYLLWELTHASTQIRFGHSALHKLGCYLITGLGAARCKREQINGHVEHTNKYDAAGQSVQSIDQI